MVDAAAAATGGANGTQTGNTGAGATGGAAQNVIAASAAAAAAAAKTGSGAATGAGATGGEGAQGGAGQPGAVWGDNWREEYSQDNAARLNVLRRYTSPSAALDALFAARQRIDSGEVNQPLPANPTPEQIADYRARNHIPEKPEGYLADLPKGLEIKDYNKDAVSDFAAAMHKHNMPPAAVQEAIRWQNEWQGRQIEARVEADNTLKSQVEDALRADWGNDFRVNMNSIHSMLGSAPEEVSKAILNARTADGNPLASSAEVVRWLAKIARDLNPVATIIPGANGSTGLASADDRIAEIEKFMRTNNAAYVKDEKTQAEYRALLDARDTMKRRSAA